MRRTWFLLSWCLAGFGLVWGLGASENSAWAQPLQPIPVRVGDRMADEDPPRGPTFVTNREMTRRLKIAKERIAGNDYRSAVRYLQSILDDPEDWFLDQTHQSQPAIPGNPGKANSVQVPSLKFAAEQLIALLPKDGRETYRQNYGLTASILLKEAVAAGDLEKLRAISRQYFHTPAGYEAVFRLGLIAADKGDSLAGALHFQRLQKVPQAAEMFEPILSLNLAFCYGEIGFKEETRKALLELKRKSPGGKIRVGRKSVELFDRQDQAEAWLAALMKPNGFRPTTHEEQWLLFRGNLNRNATSAPASPVGPVAWSRSTIREEGVFGFSPADSTRIERTLEELRKARSQDKKLLPVPSTHPLIVNDLAIFRTLQNVQAVDLNTGEIRWKTANTDPVLRPVLAHQSAVEPPVEEPSPFGSPRPQIPTALEAFLIQRDWRDMTHSLLSSDSQHVYAVEDVGLTDGMNYVAPSPNDPLICNPHNKLLAYDVAHGRAQWEVGGHLLLKGNPLAGTFFLGPPLPIGSELYCLGERNEEISLMTLDSATGKLIWEQRLVSPTMGLMANRERRQTGLSPAFGQGVLVCPTATGAVIGVDLSRRMLLWAYQYESNQTEDDLATDMVWRQGRMSVWQQTSVQPESRWADSVPLVAQGFVLITPSDSNELHCLELSTGTLKWKVNRNQGVYLAGVENELAIVVGRSEIQAFQLRDGKHAWTDTATIPQPAGRGFFGNGKFHLPLSTGEIATLDLKTGRQLARTKLPGGPDLGNMISAGGRVVFQSTTSVGAFKPWGQLQKEMQQTFQKNPDDAQALALRGLLAFHRGEEAKAIADLQKSWVIQPREETRRLLVETLLDRLQKDPAGSQNQRGQLRELLRTSGERERYLMLTAQSATDAPARAQAFRDYLKLAISLGETWELQKVRTGHLARSDTWITARIQQLAEKADAKELVHWDQIVKQEIEGALKTLSASSTWKILSCCPRLPSVVKAQLELVKSWGNTQTQFVKVRRLEQLRLSGQADIQQAATLELAETYISLGREVEAYPLIQELGKNWPKSWKENFQTWKPAEKVDWSQRTLSAKLQERQVAVLPETIVKVRSAQNTPYAQWTFSVEQQAGRLMARDENGEIRWHLDLAETAGPIIDVEAMTISLNGHLALVTFDLHFTVLDLLTRQNTAKVLWSEMLFEEGTDISARIRRRRHLAFGPPVEEGEESLGRAALVGEDVVVYQVGGRLTAAEALTGKPLWVREDISPESRLIGGDQHLVLIAPGGMTARILRGLDGETVRRLPLPLPKNQFAFDGEHLLHWTTTNQWRNLECLNLRTGKLRWKIPCPKETLLRHVGTEELALLHSNGQFLVVSKVDGLSKINGRIEPDKLRKSFQVFRLDQCYLLLTEQDVAGQPGVRANPFRTIPNATPVNGPVYAFDRKSGELLWKTQIENQSLDILPPFNSPVILFYTRRAPGPGIRGIGSNTYLVRLIDLRTGKLLFEHNRLKNVSPFSLRISPNDKLATIKFYEGILEVTSEPVKNPLPKLEK